MKIHYLGHSCFRLISDLGTTVVCDPYRSDYVGFSMPSVRCDLVTVSHHHNDHDCCDAVSGSFAEADAEAAFAADDIAVESFSTYHDDKQGKLRGKNLVFSFVIDGLKVFHMGDIGCWDENVASRIKNCDVLLIPVGGVYTINAREAKRYVDEAKPKYVIPMHYNTDGLKFHLDGLDEFLNLFDDKIIERKSSYSFVLDGVYENADTKIVTLQRYEE